MILMDRDNKSEIRNSEEWNLVSRKHVRQLFQILATEGSVFRVPSDKRREI